MLSRLSLLTWTMLRQPLPCPARARRTRVAAAWQPRQETAVHQEPCLGVRTPVQTCSVPQQAVVDGERRGWGG